MGTGIVSAALALDGAETLSRVTLAIAAVISVGLALLLPLRTARDPSGFRAETRARVQQHWEASERGDVDAEHAIYAADAILDYPQSGEPFRGRSRIRAKRGGHPAERHFTIRRILGGGDLVGERVRDHL